MNMFEKSRNPGEDQIINGKFAGLGKLNESSMVTFNPSEVKISALVCSTNKISGDFKENDFLTLSCDMNISNNRDSFIEGKDIYVFCHKACENDPKEVYGNRLYHGDSSICKSAVHSGAIGVDGGKAVVRVQTSEGNFNGLLKNGIRSQDHVMNGLPGFIVIKYVPNCPYGKKQNFSLNLLEIPKVQHLQ